MKKSTLLKIAGLAAAAVGTALAAQVSSGDAFYTYYDTVKNWTNGGLGIGLASTMLLMGGAIGVAKNSPMPALSGVAGAAFLHWGPNIILNIMNGGALF